MEHQVRFVFSKRFIKHYQKRILSQKKLERKYKERFERFVVNRNDPLLRDHALIGSKSMYRSFSITGDIRVIYQEKETGVIELIDVGSHNQVYS